jgi:hypothetical protein
MDLSKIAAHQYQVESILKNANDFSFEDGVLSFEYPIDQQNPLGASETIKINSEFDSLEEVKQLFFPYIRGFLRRVAARCSNIVEGAVIDDEAIETIAVTMERMAPINIAVVKARAKKEQYAFVELDPEHVEFISEAIKVTGCYLLRPIHPDNERQHVILLPPEQIAKLQAMYTVAQLEAASSATNIKEEQLS